MQSSVETPAGKVSVAYDLPGAHAQAGTPVVILAHGAGSNMHSPALARTARAVAAAGFVACRFNFAYREAGRRLPDRLPALTACYTAVLEHVRSDPAGAPAWIAIGGRSLGGRVATHLAASGTHVRGLVLLAFPLHPPGKPESSRAGELDPARPTLIVNGDKDPFGVPTPGGEVVVVVRPGERHDLRRDPAGVAAVVGTWLVGLLGAG